MRPSGLKQHPSLRKTGERANLLKSFGPPISPSQIDLWHPLFTLKRWLLTMSQVPPSPLEEWDGNFDFWASRCLLKMSQVPFWKDFLWASKFFEREFFLEKPPGYSVLKMKFWQSSKMVLEKHLIHRWYKTIHQNSVYSDCQAQILDLTQKGRSVWLDVVTWTSARCVFRFLHVSPTGCSCFLSGVACFLEVVYRRLLLLLFYDFSGDFCKWLEVWCSEMGVVKKIWKKSGAEPKYRCCMPKPKYRCCT